MGNKAAAGIQPRLGAGRPPSLRVSVYYLDFPPSSFYRQILKSYCLRPGK